MRQRRSERLALVEPVLDRMVCCCSPSVEAVEPVDLLSAPIQRQQRRIRRSQWEAPDPVVVMAAVVVLQDQCLWVQLVRSRHW